MKRIIEMNIVIFLFVQLCFLTVIRAFHETVNIKIKNGDEIIELNWKRTGQYVANHNLPVWYALKNAEPRLLAHAHPRKNQFITYHDVEKSSAVVYCTGMQKFFGIIDTRFYIARLPLTFDPDVYYEVGGDYISAIHDENYFHDSQENWLHNLFSDDEMKFINSIIASNNADPVPGPSSQPDSQEQPDHNLPSTFSQGEPLGESKAIHHSSHSPHSKVLYPEILVFITHDVFEMYRNSNLEQGISNLVLYHVMYFNAVDMLFAKLATDDIAIHINIAGLVIESEPGVFLYNFHKCTEPNSYNSALTLNSDEVLLRVSYYIFQHKNIFVEDLFDFYFISTRFRIGFGSKTVQGKSTSPINVYEQRLLQRPHDVLSGSVVQRITSLLDYVVATREIAQLINIKRDLTSDGLIESGNKCQSIMENGDTHCRNCLKWTKKNILQLETYVRFNLNHCFLLNFPRSLYPYDQPRASISPEDQCMCYNYPKETLNLFYIMSVPADSCDKKMRCSYRQNPLRRAPLPIDGTPCGGSLKVCWRKKCVEVGQLHETGQPHGNCHQEVTRKRPSDNRE